MLDPAIESFLAERKATWLKEKLKPCKTDEEKQETEAKATEKFCLENWLPDAAKRSGWLSMNTHPGKFSHPSAKTSALIAKAQASPDGFLRSGNVDAQFDVLGNAAAMDVYKFLSLSLTDGQTVLAHLEQDSQTIQQQFTLSSASFQEIQQGLLAIKAVDANTIKTSERVKQVFFPVGDDYHLLSILTPSGLLFKLRRELDEIRFSEQTKQGREAKKKNEHYPAGFKEIYDLTAIGFGGTKPQNISVLNSQHGGVAYLLPSLPPSFDRKNLRPPTTDFFRNSVYLKNYSESFKAFHRLLDAYLKHPTIDIKISLENIIVFLINQIIEKAWTFRQLDAGWSTDEACKLPEYQKIWLDNARTEERGDDWLKKVIEELGLWFQRSYERLIGKEKAKKLGDNELRDIKAIIEEQKDGLL